MKAGDLVKWTFPGHEDYGIIIRISGHFGDYVDIMWGRVPAHSGSYPKYHKHLEVISEVGN